MIRKFTAGTEDARRRAFTARAGTLRGTVRAARTVTEDVDASCIPPARRPGRHPLGDPYARKALGIEG